MGNTVAASGYNSIYETSLSGGVIYAGMIINRNIEDDWLYQVVNTRILSELVKCGQLVMFDRPPVVGAWRLYEKNQERVYDQPQGGTSCISICMQAYKSVKIDEQDIRRMCANWEAYEDAFLTDLWYSLSGLWKQYVITGMMLHAASTNFGLKAGRFGNINLGAAGNALHLTPQNIIGFLDNMKNVLKQAGRWNEGQMFMLVPPAMLSLLTQTFYEKQLCCDIGSTVAFKGLRAESILGFTLVETEFLQPFVDPTTKRLVYPIIAGWNEAFAFAGDIIAADLDKIPHSWGVSYNLLSLYGGGAIYPEGLAKAYVSFSTDGLAA